MKIDRDNFRHLTGFGRDIGRDADTIAAQVGARNVEQVQRLLIGSTYSRIL